MGVKNGAKFKIKVDKMSEHSWSIGICLSHWWNETYVFINAFKWSISIGFLYDDEVLEDD